MPQIKPALFFNDVCTGYVDNSSRADVSVVADARLMRLPERIFRAVLRKLAIDPAISTRYNFPAHLRRKLERL